MCMSPRVRPFTGSDNSRREPRLISNPRDSRRYPLRPILGVGALIIRRGRVLLAERGHEPMKGVWSLPGGVVEVGETLETAIRREVREETGLEVKVTRLFEIFERIMPDEKGRSEYHYVLLDYLCRPAGGALAAGDDVSRVEWVAEGDLKEYDITEGTKAVIRRAFRATRKS